MRWQSFSMIIRLEKWIKWYGQKKRIACVGWSLIRSLFVIYSYLWYSGYLYLNNVHNIKLRSIHHHTILVHLSFIRSCTNFCLSTLPPLYHHAHSITSILNLSIPFCHFYYSWIPSIWTLLAFSYIKLVINTRYAKSTN